MRLFGPPEDYQIFLGLSIRIGFFQLNSTIGSVRSTTVLSMSVFTVALATVLSMGVFTVALATVLSVGVFTVPLYALPRRAEGKH